MPPTKNPLTGPKAGSGRKARASTSAQQGRSGAKQDAKAVITGGVAGGVKRAGQRAGDAAKHGGAAGGRSGPGGMKLPGGMPKSRGTLAKGAANRVLLAEMLLCLVILGAGTVVAPKGSGQGIPRLMVKGSALLALFLVLALISSGGKAAAKVASGLGLLVTAGYVFVGPDANELLHWAGAFFGKNGGGVGAAGGAPGPGGTVGGIVGQAATTAAGDLVGGIAASGGVAGAAGGA